MFKGRGPSTASQTAWAVMGLCTFGDPHRPSLVRGIEYLIRTQNPDGSWSEQEITGTGFPKVYYLEYDMYRNSWPHLALATYRQLLAQTAKQADSAARSPGDNAAAGRQSMANAVSYSRVTVTTPRLPGAG